jgi:hypothetical protein
LVGIHVVKDEDGLLLFFERWTDIFEIIHQVFIFAVDTTQELFRGKFPITITIALLERVQELGEELKPFCISDQVVVVGVHDSEDLVDLGSFDMLVLE